jgi:hypothetical protein
MIREMPVEILDTAVAAANMNLLKHSMLFLESSVICGARDTALDAAKFNFGAGPINLTKRFRRCLTSATNSRRHLAKITPASLFKTMTPCNLYFEG